MSVALLVLGLLGVPGLARHPAAETWAGISPGESRRRDVETQFGRPSRERTVVEEGRSVPEWTYAGDRAPKGVERVVVSFGLVRPHGFAADLVRAVTVYPRPRLFRLNAITEGWGKPDAIGTEEGTGRPALRFDRRGLLIVLDPTGAWAEMMLFAPTPATSRP